MPNSLGNRRRLRILAIDGGGIRGTFAASVLERLEEHFGAPITSRFDLIVGTSTGSIIAAALAAGMTAGQTLDFYRKWGPHIFHNNRAGTWGNFRRSIRQMLWSSKYNNKRLREALTACGMDKLSFGDIEHRCLLAITSYDLNKGDPITFRTEHLQHGECHPDWSLLDAVVCSCAAPTFFPPVAIGDGLYADGGLWANNPALVALAEARRLARFQGNPLDECAVLSISSLTAPDYFAKPPGSLLGWNRRLLSSFLASQTTSATELMELLLADGDGEVSAPVESGLRHLRIDVPRGAVDKSITTDNTDPEAMERMIFLGRDMARQALQDPNLTRLLG